MTAATPMRALLLDAERHLTLVDTPIPALERPDDVLVRVRAVGVCGSDLHGYLGHTGRQRPAARDGARGDGRGGRRRRGRATACVRAIASPPTPSRRAATAVPAWRASARCASTACILGMNAPGAYAEYVVWPEDSLPALPDGLSYEAGALAEPLAVALHGVNMAAHQAR